MSESMFKGNWSFSKLMMFESCPLRFKFRYIDFVPEPPPKKGNPLERGTRIHTVLEDYVKGTRDDFECEAKAITNFAPALTHLRELYRVGMATAEQDWYFDENWNPTTRDNVWLWVKLDWNVVDESQSLAVPGDYKSGKSQYKVIEHVQQLQLYSAATALKYEHINSINPELHYVDEGWVRGLKFSREEAMFWVGRFDQRAKRMYEEKFFRPNANKDTCKFCPYGPRNGNGHCPVGV